MVQYYRNNKIPFSLSHGKYDNKRDVNQVLPIGSQVIVRRRIPDQVCTCIGPNAKDSFQIGSFGHNYAGANEDTPPNTIVTATTGTHWRPVPAEDDAEINVGDSITIVAIKIEHTKIDTNRVT